MVARGIAATCRAHRAGDGKRTGRVSGLAERSPYRQGYRRAVGRCRLSVRSARGESAPDDVPALIGQLFGCRILAGPVPLVGPVADGEQTVGGKARIGLVEDTLRHGFLDHSQNHSDERVALDGDLRPLWVTELTEVFKESSHETWVVVDELEYVHHYPAQDLHSVRASREARVGVSLQRPDHELVQAEEDFILAGYVVIEGRLLQPRSLGDHIHIDAVIADLVEEGRGAMNDLALAAGCLFDVDLGAAPAWRRRGTRGHRALSGLATERLRSLLGPLKGPLCSLHSPLLPPDQIGMILA